MADHQKDCRGELGKDLCVANILWSAQSIWWWAMGSSWAFRVKRTRTHRNPKDTSTTITAPDRKETPEGKSHYFPSAFPVCVCSLFRNSNQEPEREGDAGKCSLWLTQVHLAAHQTPLIKYSKVITHIFGETAHFNHNYMINISWYISLSYN